MKEEKEVLNTINTKEKIDSKQKTIEKAASENNKDIDLDCNRKEKIITTSNTDDKINNTQETPNKIDASSTNNNLEHATTSQNLNNTLLQDMDSTTDELDFASIQKKFKKSKKLNIPSSSEVPRFEPNLTTGLTTTQINMRYQQYLFNDTNHSFSKTYTSIILGNLITFFNILCIMVAIALLFAHAPLSQYLFVVIFSANVTFGIVIEIRAKKKLDKLSLLNAPSAQVLRNQTMQHIAITNIVLDDIVFLNLGNQIPADCIICDGTVEVNESLLTGESIPIKKEVGDLLYAGSFISSGTCLAQVDKVGKETYLNSLSSKAKKYQKPNSQLINSTKIIIMIIGFLILPISIFMGRINYLQFNSNLNLTIQNTVSIIIGMIPSGMLLLTSVALTIGNIRLLTKEKTLLQDLYSLEMLARVNVLCLDKTGTITDGKMKVNDIIQLKNPTNYPLPEIIANTLYNLNDSNQTAQALFTHFGHSNTLHANKIVPFSSKRKYSAVTFEEIGTIATGAPEFLSKNLPKKISKMIEQFAQMGLRILLVAHTFEPIHDEELPEMTAIAIISIADNIRPDAIDTIKWFKENDVAIKIISGDNPITVAEVAKRVGVTNADKYISLEGLSDEEVSSIASKYTVFGRVTPEQKAILVKSMKTDGSTVAMTGDGVNDILAMKESDCAISVASGSDAAKNVSHILLMDDNFAHMPQVVFEGRRVINNIQNSSSLYLMKTLFTTIFAVISILAQTAYPFQTNNLMLLELFVIGIPSFFLSLQPNKNRVTGGFLSKIIMRALPFALLLVLSVESVYLLKWIAPENYKVYLNTPGQIQSIQVLCISLVGVVMLFRICQPFNLLRACIFITMFIAVLLGIRFLPNVFFSKDFKEHPLDLVAYLYVALVVFACFLLSNLFTYLFEKWLSKKRSSIQRLSANN